MFNVKKLCFYLLIACVSSFLISTIIFLSTDGIPFVDNKKTSQKISAKKIYSVEDNKIESTSKEEVLDDKKNLWGTDINNIVINSSSISVNIISEDRKDIEAELTGKVESVQKEDYTLNIEKKNNTIEVTAKLKNDVHFFHSASELKLNVKIPNTYKENMDIENSSGAIALNDLSIKNLLINIDSGSVKSNNIVTQSSKINISSGNVEFTKYSGNLSLKSNSGSSSIEYLNFDNNIDASTSSGIINILLPKSSEFYLKAKASSGIVACDFPVGTQGNKKTNELEGTVKSNKNKINIEAFSGVINVKEK